MERNNDMPYENMISGHIFCLLSVCGWGCDRTARTTFFMESETQAAKKDEYDASEIVLTYLGTY